jgi:lipoprotein-anchoring transpeptidase ErfK/SrfK
MNPRGNDVEPHVVFSVGVRMLRSHIALIAALWLALPAGRAAAEESSEVVKEVPPPAAVGAEDSASREKAPAEAPAGPKPAEPAAAATKQADGRTEDKKVAPPPKPAPTLTIAVDLARQRMTVADHGHERYTWPISSGRSAEYATPDGTFRPQWMAKMWYSRKYDDAPMPNAIFFTGGFAIHGTQAVGSLGRPASHGCVRLSPSNAAVLYKMVQSQGMDRTRITVRGKAPYAEPSVASREWARDRDSANGDDAPRYRRPTYRYRQDGDSWTNVFGGGSSYTYPGDETPRRRYTVRPAYGYGSYGYPY